GLVDERRMQRRIDSLSDHYVICGFGRVGRQVARDLRAAGARYVIVDHDPANQDHVVGPGVRFICASPSDDTALRDAGIDRDRAYVTNAVKHFRWKPAPNGGKRRIHAKPDLWQVTACRPWLDAEFARLSPRVVVTLGATAGQALFGSSFRIGTARGESLSWQSGPDGSELTVVPTVHPSSIVRIPGSAERDEAYADFVKDLQVAAALLAGG
ncbi:MAG TPA: uracil-DNA glycosylase family protein, partial [Trebonia sp.]|nr:uracil-DNA glycosylase family protein [Trebonia sp.]